MLPQTIRLVAKQSATTTRLSPAFVSTIPHRSYSQQWTSQASPLTPPDHLHDKERLGYNPDVGTGDASLRRIDWIMGAFVGVGVVIAGWTYFRSSSVKKQRLEGAGGGGMKVNEPKLV